MFAHLRAHRIPLTLGFMLVVCGLLVLGGYAFGAFGDPPTISSFSADASAVPFKGTTTLRFTIADATSWYITSSSGNNFAPSGSAIFTAQYAGTGSGTFAAQYQRVIVGERPDYMGGEDTLTLTATGPGGTRAQTLTITLPAPVVHVFTADTTTVPLYLGTTLRFQLQHARSYTLTSDRGYTVPTGGGTHPGVTEQTAEYLRTSAGDDTVTLRVRGFSGLVTTAQITIR